LGRSNQASWQTSMISHHGPGTLCLLLSPNLQQRALFDRPNSKNGLHAWMTVGTVFGGRH
jgi:hypothetical protein